MNIACSTLPYRGYPLSEALRNIAGVGIKRVELCVDPLHSDPNRWKEGTEGIKSLLENSGLVLNSIHVPLPEEIPDTPYDMVREEWYRSTRRSIELAAMLGAPFVVQHVRVIGTLGVAVAGETLPDLCEVARYAETKRIKVAIENVPTLKERMLGARIEEVIDVVDTLPEKTVGICLDVSHCLACGRDPVEALESVDVRRLLSIHASDNRMNLSRDVHLPLGSGDIPWKRILETLEYIGFNGSFVIEVADEGRRRGEALRESLEFLRGIYRFDECL
jgi:sugar phosphate isomerase/epimerase